MVRVWVVGGLSRLRDGMGRDGESRGCKWLVCVSSSREER